MTILSYVTIIILCTTCTISTVINYFITDMRLFPLLLPSELGAMTILIAQDEK
jgi:hypothetical protein